MGWAFCGKNATTGQLMGYGIVCKCHKRGCKARIDRGLAYVCGDMHEGGEFGCGYYFCGDHRCYVGQDSNGSCVTLCAKCADRYLES